MDESDKILLDIVETLYTEWLEIQKRKYSDLEGYDKYKKIILDTFGYDIERASIEQERNTDFTNLERKLQIMKLNQKLKEEEKKKKRERRNK
ncbi:MAG: hypothetical protein OSJ62_11000 [Lachnospiraceae bacterium]|nr:hypothetical protein [Lachnospiraceae bacterium]